MPTINNTKRRFTVTVTTRMGATMNSTISFSGPEVDQFRKAIKEQRFLEIPISLTTVAVLPHDMVGFMIVEEILVDKLNEKKESTIITGD